MAYVRQGEPLGLGHAVLVTKNLVGDEPFAVILGDDVIDANPPALKPDDRRVRARAGSGAGGRARARRRRLELRHRRHRRERLDLGRGVHRITDLVEKPRARGCAVEPGDHRPLHPDARHLRRARSHRRAIAPAKSSSPTACGGCCSERPIYACEIDGVRHDTGNKLGFLKALVYFALQRPELAEPFRHYLESLDLKIGVGS